MGDRAAVSRRTILRPRKLVEVAGVPVQILDPEGFVHLQFRRSAGCPICNVHLQRNIRRHDEIVAAGIREVVVFHSSAQELRRHVVDLPFAVVADPDKVLYASFGIRSSARGPARPARHGAGAGTDDSPAGTRGSKARPPITTRPGAGWGCPPLPDRLRRSRRCLYARQPRL